MIAITNCKFFKDDELISNANILIADGQIQEISVAAIVPQNYETIDAGGCFVTPGFIDLQIYGSGGNLFSAYPTAATLAQMDDDLLNKGTTGFLACLATNSMDVFKEAIAAAKAYRPHAKGFLGLHLEGPFLNPKRLGAHPEVYVHKATLPEVKDLLDDAEGVVKMMTLAHELQDDEVIEYLLSKGIVLSLGHSDANFEQANRAFASGFTTTTHLYNAMPPAHHRNPGLPVAVLNHPSAMASIIADGEHIDFEVIKMTAKVMPGRLFLITDAVTTCLRGPYKHQLSGKKYVMPDGTLSGSAITMLDAVRNCTSYCDIPIPSAFKMASAYPAKVLNIENERGELLPGKAADLLLLSDELNLQKVFLAGLHI